MSTIRRMWRGLWRTFSLRREATEDAGARESGLRNVLRLAIVFALLFGGVFFAFWWAGSAVRFGAERAGNRSVPTWRVSGTVRDAVTRQPVPWALVEDDPAGQPPFFRADADHHGVFELLTLAEPHRIRVSALGYRPLSLDVGRVWFLWMPRGDEQKNVDLLPLQSRLPTNVVICPERGGI